jgi:hypothetical protein
MISRYRKKQIATFLISIMMLITPLSAASAQAQAALDKVQAARAELANLPDTGFAVLSSIENKIQKFGINFSFEQTLHDQFPKGTTVRMKCLSSGKYYAVRNNKDTKAGQQGFTLIADTKDPKDPATVFTIDRYLSGAPLKDFLGLKSNVAGGFYMQVDPETKAIVFSSGDFSAENPAAHWEIPTEITSIKECFLQNKKTGGTLTPYKGNITVKVGEDKTDYKTPNDVWLLTESALRFGGRYWLKSFYKNHYMQIPGNMTDPKTGATVMITGIYDNKKWDAGWGMNGDWGNQNYIRQTPWGKPIQTENALGLCFLDVGDLGGIAGARDGYGKELNVMNGGWIQGWETFLINKQENAPGTNPNQPMMLGQNIHFTTNDSRWFIRHVLENGYVDCRLNMNQFNPKDPHYPTLFWQFTNPGGSTNTTFSLDRDKGTATPLPGTLNQISVRHDKDVWGVNSNGQISQWNGSKWNLIPSKTSFIWVTVSKDGIVYAISTDNKLWKRTDSGWNPIKLDTPVQQISIVTDNELWLLGTDGFTYLFNGQETKRNSPPSGGIVSLATAATNNFSAVWCIDNKNNVWNLANDGKDRAWRSVDTPADNAKLNQITVRSDTDVWALSESYVFQTPSNTTNYTGWKRACERLVYHWDGKTWTQVSTNIDSWNATKFISIATGIQAIVTPALMQTVPVELAMTQSPDGKPINISAASKIGFEIINRGDDGNIPPQSRISDIDIPATKKPNISGFAQTTVSLPAGGTLKINKLVNKGAAWPESTFPVPDSCTISFLAKPDDTGDVQVMLGRKVSNLYDFKIFIGGRNNSYASIVRSYIEDNKTVEEEVYGISRTDNQLAYTPPGIFTPYWVSYNKGFILVGMGLPGENIFMSYHAQNPPTMINRVGFGSNEKPIEYSDIQYMPAIIAQVAPNPFFESTTPINSSGESISWSTYPFRIPDNGMISFDVSNSTNFSVALGQANDDKKPHYLITFDENNTAITIKKWISTTSQYAVRATLDTEKFPALKLDPATASSLWISFNDGLFIIGSGNPGEEPIFIFRDLNDYNDIKTVGFAGNASLNNFAVSKAVRLALETTGQNYTKMRNSFGKILTGDVTTILPFQYTIKQGNQVVEFVDNIMGNQFYSGATPQQGTLYYYGLTIMPDGFPKLDTSRAPNNKVQQQYQKLVVEAAASAELERAKAAVTKQSASVEQDAITAQADAERSKAQGMLNVATGISGVAAAIGSSVAWAPDPMVGGIGAAASIAMAAGAVITAGLSMQRVEDAANKDVEGAQAGAAVKRQALAQQDAAANLQFQSRLLAGDAQFAFRSTNSYVFVDKPERPSLSNASTTPETQQNKKKADSLLQAISLLTPDSADTFNRLMSGLQQVEYCITNFYVASDTVKEQYSDAMDKLYQGYQELYSKKVDSLVINSMINLLFSSINNSYLAGGANDSPISDTWYTWINEIAQQSMKQNASFTLPKCFGQYIWLPFNAPTADNLTLSCDVKGQGDFMIGFAAEPIPVRNSGSDIYEIHCGAFNNSKTVIRTESLGESVATFDKKSFKEGLLNPYKITHYTISLNKGLVSITANGKTVSWQDPYPLKEIIWVGLSCWDKPVTITNIKVTSNNSAAKEATATEALAADDETDSTPSDTDESDPIPTAVKKVVKSSKATQAIAAQPKTKSKAKPAEKVAQEN